MMEATMLQDTTENSGGGCARSGSRAIETLPDEALIDHILHRYHQAHREELPGLIQLARIVEDAHSADPAVPAGMGLLLKEIQTEPEAHRAKEEHVLRSDERRVGTKCVSQVRTKWV